MDKKKRPRQTVTDPNREQMLKDAAPIKEAVENLVNEFELLHDGLVAALAALGVVTGKLLVRYVKERADTRVAQGWVQTFVNGVNHELRKEGLVDGPPPPERHHGAIHGVAEALKETLGVDAKIEVRDLGNGIRAVHVDLEELFKDGPPKPEVLDSILRSAMERYESGPKPVKES